MIPEKLFFPIPHDKIVFTDSISDVDVSHEKPH